MGRGTRREFPLVTAIQNHDLATVHDLLDRNVSPNEPYDEPPLIIAIEHKHLDIIQLLYEYQVQGFMGEFNETEIHIAARVGHLPVLEFIWNTLKSRHGHDYLHRATLDEMTPLHSAAASGSVDCVQFLLHEGADVNSCTMHGMTPLHYAAERPSARETVEVLLEAGAQVDAVAWDGGSAIFTAIASHSDAVSILLRTSNIGLRNRYNETLAHIAAYHGPLSLLQTLVNAGADITARSITNSTVLHRAAEAGNIEMMEWILQHTRLPADEANDYGWTPLHFAVAKNHLSAVKFLVEHGADTSAMTLIPKDASALHLATYFSGEDPELSGEDRKLSAADETALISYLLARGADVSARADDALLIGFPAYESGESLLEEFYTSANETESGDQDRVTPLDCAAVIGSVPKAQILLAAGADINAQSPGQSWTALHRVAEPSPIMRFLVQNGADIQVRDNKGRSVVHYWCYYYRAAEPVRDFLVEMGVYKEDLEGDLDLKVVAPLMKGVRRLHRIRTPPSWGLS